MENISTLRYSARGWLSHFFPSVYVSLIFSKLQSIYITREDTVVEQTSGAATRPPWPHGPFTSTLNSGVK